MSVKMHGLPGQSPVRGTVELNPSRKNSVSKIDTGLSSNEFGTDSTKLYRKNSGDKKKDVTRLYVNVVIS